MRKDRIKSRDQREEMCEKCEFFGGTVEGLSSGECQRFPPSIAPIGEAVIKFIEERAEFFPQDVQPETPILINSEFPAVSEFHWCGEFKLTQSFTLCNLLEFGKKHKPRKTNHD
jgi:hypothetical protein